MNTFEKYLSESAPGIQKRVKETLMSWNSVVQKHTPLLKQETNVFMESFTGGKCIRGTLVILGHAIGGKTKRDEIEKIAAAFEILHTSLLIHDDIIDKSLYRRNKKALHVAFKNKHYSLSQAMCLGDIGFFLAIQLIHDTAITAHFSQIALETILGEMLDSKLSYETEKKESAIISMQKLKTAYYSFAGPLTIGAITGNANAKQLAAIKKFGEYLGIAYQIQDDILGIFGDEKITGKSTTSDIEENKNTLLIAHSLKKANKKQQIILKKYYGKKGVTKTHQAMIKNIFEITGSLAYSQQKAQTYGSEALTFIPTITEDPRLQQILTDLTSYIHKRQK